MIIPAFGFELDHRSPSVLTGSLLALASAVLLMAGGRAVAAPPRSESPVPAVSAQVPFPAAANIRPGPVNIGPIESATGITLVPNDVICFDEQYNGAGASSSTTGAIVNLSVHNGGTGTETVLASGSTGTGAAYTPAGGTPRYSAVSPGGLVYYFDQRTVGSTVYNDLVAVNPSTLVRTAVSAGDNTTLGPPVTAAEAWAWDFSSGTVLYFDAGNTAVTGNLGPGFFRVDPATGKRYAVSLTSNSPGSGVAFSGDVSFPVVDTFGNIFYLDEDSSGHIRSVFEIPVVAGTYDSNGFHTYGARVTVSSDTVGSQAGGTYQDLNGLWVDESQTQTLSSGLPGAESLIVSDQGTTETDSAIYRVPSNTGAKAKLISNNSTNANTGTATFDLPDGAVTDTTGRIYYDEGYDYADAGGSNSYLTVIPAGTHAATYETGAENLSTFELSLTPVPPPTPTVSTPTTSNVLGTTATLASNVTADGGVVNSGIIARGFVYALNSTNATPKIGGTGVTQVANFQATSVPVAQGSNEGAFSNNITGLTSGVSYSLSAYALDISGYTYTTTTFVTATAPVVATTTPATNLTGTSATLGGNVTSAGGGSATITSRGIVYAVNSTNPTPLIGGTGVTNLTDASATTGTYTDNATGLANGTTYAYRAYAINQIGTTYGTVSTFTTIAPPTANSQSVNVPFNTATAITLTGTDPNTPTQALTYAVTVSPTHGTLSGTAPNLTYTPTTGYHGTDSFQFTTTNTTGLTSTTAGTVTLTVAAGTPTANAQSVNVPFNTATAITLTGTDPDVPALTLTYTVATSPTHGTLSGTAPNLTYTPTANYQGTDSFTFHVSNGTNTSTNATVSITVAAGTPTANAQTVSVAHATAKAVTLTGTDPDSPALALTYTVVTAPTHGTLSGTAPNLTYTPTSTYQGSDSFTFTVSNGQKTSTAATVTLTVAAGVPTANAQSVNVNLNLPATVTLAGTDPDSPALALTYTVVTQPTNGTLSGTAPNLTYTPNTNYTGTDSFTFTVSNGQNTSAAATVSLTVIGEPTISSFTPASGPVGTLVTITGTNLQNTTGVSFFRNKAATTFAVVSSTQVTAVVPTGASSGILTVLSGSGSNSAGTKFTVTP